MVDTKNTNEELTAPAKSSRRVRKKVRHSRGDRVFYIVDMVLLSAITLVVLYPLVYIVSASFSDAQELVIGRVYLWPVKPSLEGYKAVFKYDDVWLGYGNTIFYTVFGTALNIVMTIIIAYPLSRRDFVGRNIIMFVFTFTMFFRGGLIPTYLLIKSLGLVNTRAVMIVPWALQIWNVIITRTYLQSTIPLELYDSAKVDGASNTRMLLMIVLPLSGPIIAVITLFYAVGHWNSFFPALIYLRDRSLRPLQIVLREILIMNSMRMMDEYMSNATEEQLELMIERQFMAQLLQYALIIVATFPILVMYPFVQKYFVRGIMIGAIKG
jgi:putative aldouronate transport system permease protein